MNISQAEKTALELYQKLRKISIIGFYISRGEYEAIITEEMFLVGDKVWFQKRSIISQVESAKASGFGSWVRRFATTKF